jgi:hypothetical protein
MSRIGVIKFDQALTNVSVAYTNAEFVAERVMPVVPVDKQSDKYFIHGKDRFRVRDDRRAPGGEAQESRWTLSNDTFYCSGHALKDYVPREDVANADPQLDLLTDTTEVLTDQVLLSQEVGLVAALAAGMTGTSLADQVATTWNNDANDPLAIIEAQKLVIAKRCGGRMPNVLTISAPVFSAIKNNAKVKALLTGSPDLPSTLITPAMLAAKLELEEVIIASAVKDTANEGQAATLDWVWGENALLSIRPKSPGRKVLSLGYTFKWGKAFGGDYGAQFVNRYFWQPKLSDVVEVHKYYDAKVIAADAGVLFTNCLT